MTGPSFDIELDAITLAAARRGDMAACERIYRRFQAPAFNVAVRICRCRETAQEVTQEAFITAFARLGQFRGDAPFWGWMKRVVVNHAISHIRRQPQAPHVEYDEFMGGTDGDQESIGLAMDLESALATLSDEDRAVVWLYDVEGYRHEEIAELFGKTESFSKTRLSRARARLRDLIEGRDAPSLAGALA